MESSAPSDRKVRAVVKFLNVEGVTGSGSDHSYFYDRFKAKIVH